MAQHFWWCTWISNELSNIIYGTCLQGCKRRSKILNDNCCCPDKAVKIHRFNRLSFSKIGLAPKCLVVPRYILSTITYKHKVIFASLFACAQLQINLENYEEKFAPGLNKIPTTKCIQEIWGQSRTVCIMVFIIKHRIFNAILFSSKQRVVNRSRFLSLTILHIK